MRRKFTQQEVSSYCLERGYRVLSEYKNSSTKIELQNIETGEIGEMTFGSFKQGNRFDTKKGRKKLTQQEVEVYCESQGYKVLSEYIDSKTKIILQNIKTNVIGEMTLNSFKQGQRFDNPRNHGKLTQQEVESYCESQGYRVLSEYDGINTKITLQNIETNEIGEMTFRNFKQGSRFDAKNPRKLTQQAVVDYCLKQGYKVLSKYIDSNTKIMLQNIETDEIGEMRFGSFKQGSRFDSPEAAKKLTYQQYIRPFMDKGYTVLIDEKDYKNVNVATKINVMCPNNHQWGVKRGNFISNNRRCPMCNQDTVGGMSLGEKMVYQILQGNNVNFEREKSIYIDGNRYRFDFYFKVEEFDYTDRFFIEYDGIQHYDKRNYFGDLKKIRVSDEIKNKYAHDNNIQMIRIPWLNNTIDKVLFVINGETGLNLHSVDVDLPTIQRVTNYYLNHKIQETADKFSIGRGTVDKYFKQIYGMTKREYLGISIGATKQQVVDYYLSHTLRQTANKFNIGDKTVNKYFKKINGMSKADYIGTPKQKVADYYLSHILKETTNKFNIGDVTVNRYFNQAYGMSKKEYLKMIDTTK